MEFREMSEQLTAFSALAASVSSMRQELDGIAKSAENSPWGLPGKFYVSPHFFDYERATLLRRGWHCIGRADEIPNQGDYITLQLLDEPLIVVRDKTNIKALSNVCRHRGMPLATGNGNTKRFVCSYHAWMYGTDGGLVRAGRMKNAAFDPKTCKLGTFHCVEQFGFIYVSLDDNPADIDAELTGLDELIGSYDPENFKVVHSATEIWNANWKCLIENFMEGYHLSVVHPQTLHGYTPTGLCQKAASGNGFTSYFARYPNEIPPRGHGAMGLNEEARHRSTLYSVFPCQVVSIAASLLVSLSICPLSAGSIEVKWTMSAYGDDLDEETIKQRIELWEEVNREDREKLEAMQQSLRSVHAVGGPLAEEDYEGTVHDFVLWLARQNKLTQESGSNDELN